MKVELLLLSLLLFFTVITTFCIQPLQVNAVTFLDNKNFKVYSVNYSKGLYTLRGTVSHLLETTPVVIRLTDELIYMKELYRGLRINPLVKNKVLKEVEIYIGKNERIIHNNSSKPTFLVSLNFNLYNFSTVSRTVNIIDNDTTPFYALDIDTTKQDILLTDISTSPYFNEILYVYQRGYLKGVTKELFKPNSYVSYKDIINSLYHMLNPKVTKLPATINHAYYKKYKTTSNVTIQGLYLFEHLNMALEKPINETPTKLDIAKMYYKLMELQINRMSNISLSDIIYKNTDNRIIEISDINNYTEDEQNYIYLMHLLGITKEIEFKGNEKITREEFALMLYLIESANITELIE